MVCSRITRAKFPGSLDSERSFTLTFLPIELRSPGDSVRNLAIPVPGRLIIIPGDLLSPRAKSPRRVETFPVTVVIIREPDPYGSLRILNGFLPA